MDRVAVFIDNSNLFHGILGLSKIDAGWTRLYDPLTLARRLAGARSLVYVGFYCVRPPAYLQTGGPDAERRYRRSMQFYAAIEKLPGVVVKYGSLKGNKGELVEKNLDTQLATDLVTMAALNEFDAAIIVSNDGDYVSAVETAKTRFGKRIEAAFLPVRFSMDLRRVCDLTRRIRHGYLVRLSLEGEHDNRVAA